MSQAYLSPIGAIVQGFAAQGFVSAGSTVHIFAAGSSLPVVTYTDSTLSVRNDNPIVLAANGRLPGSIWAPSGQVFKLVLKDAGGRSVHGGTIDNLPLIDDVHSSLYPKTQAETSAGVAPFNYAYPVGNVLRYGADPSGGESSFAAIRNCLRAALSGRNTSGIGDHARIYFPHGTYLIDADGVFNSSTDFQRGFIIEGDGLASSVLKLKTRGKPVWFFDNEAKSTQQYIFVTVRDLQFTSDSTEDGNGFRFQQDQGWRFFRCWLYNLGTAIASDGGFTGNNGSEHKFFACKFTHIHRAVHFFNNLQCLNIEYHGCDVENIFGDVFLIGPGGGGALRVFGGSYIMDDGGAPHYLLNIQGPGLGNNNNTYTISGIQTELHSVNDRLVFHGAGGGGAHVVFNECNFTATNGAREQVFVATARVTFNRCVLTQNQGDTYRVSGPAAGGDQYGEPGSIHFVECDVPKNLSALCSASPAEGGDGLAWGLISARGCYSSGSSLLSSSDPRSHRYALDFDTNWFNGGRASNFSGLKTISVKPQNRSWPCIDAKSDWIVTLPADALIVSIQIFRPANAGNAGPYTLHVGNGDKSLVYGSDDGGLGASSERRISLKYEVGNWPRAGVSNPHNQIRTWADPTTGYAGATGGYFIVEYY